MTPAGSPTPDRNAVTSVPLHPLLAQRWSPRALDPEDLLSDRQMAALLEAARWAPSSGNGQPWRFVVARRGSAVHERVFGALRPGNQSWAGAASVLLVALAETEDADGRARPTATYDVGSAVAHLSIQAAAEGLSVHQMAGFNADTLHHALGLDPRLRPVVVAALGRHAPDAALPDGLSERERAPRTRLPLAELVLSDDLVLTDSLPSDDDTSDGEERAA